MFPIKIMFYRFFAFIVLLFVAAVVQVSAQNSSISHSNAADASKSSSYERGRDDEPSEGLLETRYRWHLREMEKEHREMLDRSGSIARLSDELNRSFGQNKALATVDSAKIADLEKQLKKLRKSLGGSNDKSDSEQDNPASLADAIDKLAALGASLNDELKESSRYEVSASSIENTNEMLKLLEFIRSGQISNPK